ncbi:carbamate kinase [Olsenella massiliensis]|uniref:carbamate kinase n=1 Tax=Olsenella massiliensis TaxID=1622075 RepID=UPI00071E0A4B|nr:carbamate kinase [Olsenella massiliensis]
MSDTIVVALGGNALGKDLPGQMAAVRRTARSIADLAEAGNDVVVVHGNGPQVGMIQEAMTQLTRSDPARYAPCPLSVCVAMSQGYIGYDLQNAIREELANRGVRRGVTTVLTQVEVDRNDEAFGRPTKPIGAFMSKDEADALVRDRGCHVVEDAGRGWRQVVASPSPVSIVELDTIRSLVAARHVVIACGGGGVPVCRAEGNHLKGVPAVIDKDFAAARLAEQLDARELIILTAVEKVAVHFGRPDERWLDDLGPEEAQGYIASGEFAPGSMLPKVQAALQFACSGVGKSSLITELDRAAEGIAGKTGTRIHS